MNTKALPAPDRLFSRTAWPPHRAEATKPAARPAPPSSGTPRWSSEALLHGGQQVEIAHGDQVYRLRLTSLGKLILTK